MDIEKVKQSLDDRLVLSEDRYQQVNYKSHWPGKLDRIKSLVLGEDIMTKSELLDRLAKSAIEIARLCGEHLVNALLNHFSTRELESVGLYVNPGEYLEIDDNCPSRNPQLLLGHDNPDVSVRFKGICFPALHVYGSIDNMITLDNGVCSGYGAEHYVTRHESTLMCRGMHDVVAEDRSLVKSNSQSVVHMASPEVKLFAERMYGSYMPLTKQDQEMFENAFSKHGPLGVFGLAKEYASAHVWDLDFKQVNICSMLSNQQMIARNNRFLLLRDPSGGIVLREGFSTKELFKLTEEMGMPATASLSLRQIKNRLHMEEYSAIALRGDMSLVVPGEGRCFLRFVRSLDSFEIVNPRKSDGVVMTIPYDEGLDTVSNILSIRESFGQKHSQDLPASLSAEVKHVTR